MNIEVLERPGQKIAKEPYPEKARGHPQKRQDPACQQGFYVR
jgi:hypothetical protein